MPPQDKSAHQETVPNERLQCIKSAFEYEEWVMQVVKIGRRATTTCGVINKRSNAAPQIDSDMLLIDILSTVVSLATIYIPLSQ